MNDNTITTTAEAITKANSKETLVNNLTMVFHNGAEDVGPLIKNLAVLDPELNASIQGKSALGSKTLWSGLVVHILTWAVGYFGLDWDAATTESIAGLVSWLILMGLRFVTKLPITSFLPKTKTGV